MRIDDELAVREECTANFLLEKQQKRDEKWDLFAKFALLCFIAQK